MSNNEASPYVRTDKPNLLELNIHVDSLVDRKSGIAFFELFN